MAVQTSSGRVPLAPAPKGRESSWSGRSYALGVITIPIIALLVLIGLTLVNAWGGSHHTDTPHSTYDDQNANAFDAGRRMGYAEGREEGFVQGRQAVLSSSTTPQYLFATTAPSVLWSVDSLQAVQPAASLRVGDLAFGIALKPCTLYQTVLNQDAEVVALSEVTQLSALQASNLADRCVAGQLLPVPVRSGQGPSLQQNLPGSNLP